MEDLINSVKKSLEDGNLYGALFISLALPDICGNLEGNSNIEQRYVSWFETYMPTYKQYLSGKDAYALRCAIFHEGSDNISMQKSKEILEHFILTDGGPAKTLFVGGSINGQKENFLQLETGNFCLDICKGVNVWLRKILVGSDIRSKLKQTVKIQPQGYIYKGAIKFGSDK